MEGIEGTYTVEEVADYLRVSEKTVRNYLRSGKLKAYRIGNRYNITSESVKSFVESTKVNFDEEKETENHE